MKVTFAKRGASVQRPRPEGPRARPLVWIDRLRRLAAHDLLHFVAEAEFGLDRGIFGDLASGGDARIFLPTDRALIAKMRRKQRIRPAHLQQKLDELARRWHALQVGESLTLEWPRPEGRRHPPRDRKRPPAVRGR